MKNFNHKIKKLNSVIKVRERELNLTRGELVKIQQQKIYMMGELNKSQQKYMNSVDTLNKLRMMQASEAETLAIESSIEYVRNNWATQLTEVRKLERQEKTQAIIVQELESKLRAVESINEKYEHEFKKERAKKEQDALDEFVIGRYGR